MKKRRISPGRNSRRRMKRALKHFLAIINKQREEIESHARSEVQENMRQDFCVIYESEIDAMRQEVLQYPKHECGGLLMGHVTRTGAMVLDLTLKSGGNPKHGTCDFRPDLTADAITADAMLNNYAIEELGSWHSHHVLNLPRPSMGDIEMVNRLWTALPRCVTRYIMIIATIDMGKVNVHPYLFERHEAEPRKLDVFILKGVSPFNGISVNEVQHES